MSTKPPKRYAAVTARTPRGTIKEGKFLRTECDPKTGGNVWYVLQAPDKSEFKARPSTVSAA